MIRHPVAALALATLIWLGLAAAPGADANGPVTLVVEVTGSVPGIKDAELPGYLADRLAAISLPGWRFVPGLPGGAPAANRMQWSFRPNPYAGGAVRYLGPLRPGADLFAVHRLISAEARLYLNGEYQRLSFAQSRIRGGVDDAPLGALVATLANGLLANHDPDD